ncbi:hypothetical protein ASG25_01955 [Rhizobium sp. Leaf384]|uniref:hypothetical protein n=1 Tax=unclassified Rhizobium TaxID=2613769 RepID=UPI0007136383|nr:MULTISPECIES: hypothetical protein [unclassified Rhizobium]KQS74203.1 hypothetical protein ASG58_17020 [Rhizobium sp. Leaf383]KQS80398.1 hypothetical protein ASG25_01955 [Rhizobium sp. Leaf384]
MWLILTQKNNATTVVDFGKVAFFCQTDEGDTRIEFAEVVVNSKHVEVFKSITVTEKVEAIAKLLKARSAR